MKAIQFTIDEELLRRLDGIAQVKQHGRSAFLRHLVEQYLQRGRERAIRDAYRRGYGAHPPTDEEFDLAPEGRAWPEE